MSLDALIFRPLLLLIHTTDILISHISSLLPSPDNSVSTDRVPRHVAFSFITEGNVEDVKRRLGVIIGDLASWAAEVGVEEVSLWNEAGLLDDGAIEQSALRQIPHESHSKGPNLIDDRILPCGPEEKDPEWITVDLPSDTAPSQVESDIPTQTHAPATRTYSIPFSRYSDKSSPKEVRIHTLPRSTAAGGTIIARITRRLVEQKVPPERITQELLDARIREYLGFNTDPCLLIIQPVPGSCASGIRSLLPVEPPAIHGYPFWPLRVTEIFLAANRSRKVSEVVSEWNRAVRRWQGVEQRLGR